MHYIMENLIGWKKNDNPIAGHFCKEKLYKGDTYRKFMVETF